MRHHPMWCAHAAVPRQSRLGPQRVLGSLPALHTPRLPTCEGGGMFRHPAATIAGSGTLLGVRATQCALCVSG